MQIPIRNLLGYTRKHKKPKAHKVELSTGARWSRDKKGGDGGNDDAEAGAEAGEKYMDEDGHTTPARQESIQEAKERARKITAAQVRGEKRKSFSELALIQKLHPCTLTMSVRLNMPC